uniref:Uncharacterized protein n=1 Tax=Avena sativa TaxID=4498 RepID=A0ACD5WPN6_AVESA
MTSRRPLDCAQRCPCSGESYLHHHYPYSHAQAPAAMLATAGHFAEAPPGGDIMTGSDGKASSQLLLAREAGVRAATRGSNSIVSPLSIHAALALVAAGARGETLQELLGFLGAASLDELHGAPAMELVGKLDGLTQTSFACGVWVGLGQVLQPEFMATAASRHAATAESVDFVSDPEKARQRVNDFVENATNKLIRDVLPQGSVDSSTVVVLANALYFKGTWAQPFDPSATFTAPFHTPDGTVVRVPFMTTGRFDFKQQVAVYPGFRALKLPYNNDGDHRVRPQAAFYMLLLLPDRDVVTLSLADLYGKAAATPEFIKRHTPAAQVPVGRFMVPKFKFTFKFEASDDMRNLGVKRAFGGGDFSGMVRGGNGLFISGVYHKATIEVDELGTVAAAATAVVMSQSGSLPRPPVDFVADRPFLFAIVEEMTSTVLFLGHVVNPLDE